MVVFRFRRWWLLFGAVLVGVVALNGVVDAKAVAARGAVCVRVGAKALDGVSGRGLVCVQTKARGLRWRFEPTTVTTTTSTSATTTVASANVAPRVVSASAVTGNAVITIADMSPDTGVYAVQWVPVGQGFNSYQMFRTTTKTMTVPYLSCTRTYTLRVFVMQENWQMTNGFVNQNVTPHSATFDLTMPACTATAAAAAAPAAPVTCATGGTCIVGDTGPGGGIVFYVSADPFTSTGSDCNTTCKYLEAATTDQSTGIVWAPTFNSSGNNLNVCYADGSDSGTSSCTATGIYSLSEGQATSRTAASAIGMGMANTNKIHAVLTTTGNAARNAYAADIARNYENNSKTDWHLPSKDEIRQLFIQQIAVGGFSSDLYWSSTENIQSFGTIQQFPTDLTGGDNKGIEHRVRVVRAFG